MVLTIVLPSRKAFSDEYNNSSVVGLNQYCIFIFGTETTLLRDNLKEIRLSVFLDVSERNSDQTVGSILTKFVSQVVRRKILVKFGSGKNSFNCLKMAAILNS